MVALVEQFPDDPAAAELLAKAQRECGARRADQAESVEGLLVSWRAVAWCYDEGRMGWRRRAAGVWCEDQPDQEGGMRQGGGQANPDPVSQGSPSAPPRRRVWRWLVLLLTLVGPLAFGVWGWFDPARAWLEFGVVTVVTVCHTAQRWEDGEVPQWGRPRWVAWMIGYGVLCGGAVAVGAWLAR
jgi:hypothetical protein